jgi:hypothetical protein
MEYRPRGRRGLGGINSVFASEGGIKYTALEGIIIIIYSYLPEKLNYSAKKRTIF